MKDSIRLSEKHGLNPSLLICPVCGKDTGVALVGRLPEDEQAPRKMLDRGPCEACVSEFDKMKSLGFLILVVRPGCDPEKAPVWQYFHSAHVIKSEALGRIFTPETDISQGLAFMEFEVAKKIGLPVEEKAKEGA